MKQTIEDILKPVKFVDEAVLRQYTKLTRKWEAKGRSRYSLAHAFQLPTIPLGLYFVNSFYPPSNSVSLLGFLLGSELGSNLTGPNNERSVSSDRTLVESSIPINRFYKKVSNRIRLPLFISGVGMIAKGGLDLVDYMRTQNPESLNNALFDMSLGYTFFGNASSMYVKESNPKLLDKTPAWKTAYNFVKEKVSGLIPGQTPEPVPVPVRACERFEGGRLQ